MARVSALLRFEKRRLKTALVFSNQRFSCITCARDHNACVNQTLVFSIRHPELEPEICLPLPHCFAATSEGSAPLLFRAAHGAYPICTHLALICGRVSIAIVWQSRRFSQSWQYNKFTLWLTCGTHPYPLPIHPKSSHFGVTSSQELPGKSSQPDRF